MYSLISDPHPFENMNPNINKSQRKQATIQKHKVLSFSYLLFQVKNELLKCTLTHMQLYPGKPSFVVNYSLPADGFLATLSICDWLIPALSTGFKRTTRQFFTVYLTKISMTLSVHPQDCRYEDEQPNDDCIMIFSYCYQLFLHSNRQPWATMRIFIAIINQFHVCLLCEH